MAKSIRSKSKRKNRTEFRNTIGSVSFFKLEIRKDAHNTSFGWFGSVLSPLHATYTHNNCNIFSPIHVFAYLFHTIYVYIQQQEAAKANQAIVQAKLQQCINSGQLNSFDRISNLFAGNTTNTINNTDATTTTNDEGDDDVVMTSTSGVSNNNGKDASKIPTKKSSKSTKKTMVGYSQKMIGQYGDQTRKKVSEKRSKVRTSNGGSSRRGRSASRGRSGDGRSGGLRSSSKKSRK